MQATPNAAGGLDIGYTNLSGHILYTAALSYTVERSVEGQWGVVFGPEPVPTSTLTLAPWQTLTWTWQATDNQEGDAPPGEYRAVLLGTGSDVQSGSGDGGMTPGVQTHTRITYYYFGSQRVGMRTGVVGESGEVYYLHGDHLGSVSDVTSATGGRIAQERYYPYGRVRWGSAPTSYNFTGQRLDQSTGLLFFQARYYDPDLRRFLQPDTIVPEPGNPQSLNRYSYALGNPLKYTDPTGHVNIGGITPDDPIPFGCLTPCEIVYSREGLKNTWNAVGDVAALVVSVASEPADWIMTLNKWRQGDFQAWDLLGLAPLIPSGAGRLVGGTIDAARPLRYLRHTDSAAFETLMSLGARNGEQIFDILNSAGSDAVIRGITDRAGNQIVLLAGGRGEGLRHILGRHLTGDIPGGYTTFFSEKIKVGDVVDLIAQTVQNGERTLDQANNYWTYRWYNETWGWINVVVNQAGEVVSAYPD